MRSLSAVLASLFAVASFAQIGPIESKPIKGMRQPAISPDGSKIAFQWRGDIWVVPSEGGKALRVTSHIELETTPIWSPDGKWIAFTSDRHGNNDVFAIPAEGGEPRQLTYSGNNETATSWSPDGRWIAFAGQRDSTFGGIFVLDVRTLRFRLIAEDYQGLSNPRFSPDGRSIVATRLGFTWTRPRYHGGNAAQIVVIDIATGAVRRIVDNERQNLWPQFSHDGRSIYAVSYGEVTPSSRNIFDKPEKFVDNANKTPNLWRFDLNGRGTRVTDSVGEPIRHFSISNDGTIVYERAGDLHVMKGNATKKLDIVVFSDAKQSTIERQVLTSGASEAVVSPDGKTFAFVAGSELWTVPIEKGEGRNKDDATRLTDYPGVDGEIEWARSGDKLFFVSDRDGARKLFSIETATKRVEQITFAEADVLSPKLSPDGTTLAFWVAGSDGGLYTWRTSGISAPRKIVHQPGSHFFGTSAGEFAWSPDSKWIAFTRRQEGGTWNVWIVPAAGGAEQNVTRRNVNHGSIGWSADGKFLYLNSSREGGGFFILPLQKEIEDPQEIKLKYQKPESLSIEIDFDDIHLRLRRFFTQSPSGNVLADKETGKIYFLSAGGMWQADYNGENVRQIVPNVSSFTLSDDGKTAFGLRGGMPFKVTLSGNYPSNDVAFRAELVQDADQVRKAAFIEFWRMYNRGFYDENFHGRDWLSIRARYEPLLEGVGHRREFAELLNQMVGELEASHTEVGASPGGTPGSPSVSHPGFLFDYSYEGPGIKVKGVYDKSPASYEKTRIIPGEYVMAINGVDITLDERLWDVLHNQGGRDLTFLVNSTPTKDGAREVKYRALSSGAWSNYRYEQWVEENRKKVESASGGKIGYVHIRGMGGGDRTRFQEEFHEFKQGKEAMIIDVRFNGGGNISDSLVDVLERQPHGFYKPRDGWVETAPNTEVWNKPIVVLHNENSFSNAEMFPYAMKERGLAKLIGMPTSGYVIWTWGGRLVDGTSIRMPMSGVYRMDGTPMENMGQQPDIKIPWSNEDFMAGKDPQLDRAIQELLRGMK